MKRPRGSPPRAVEALAAAKINLGWRVGELRPDGYHDVEGLIQTLGLVDAVRVETHDDPDAVSGLRIEIEGVPVGLVVGGEEASPELASRSNLALAAAGVLARVAEPQPTTIRIDKRIPVAAGLGGGSADAAGVLFACSLAWGAPVSAGELVAMGAAIGSDVPPIVHGGLVHVAGRGERVRGLGSPGGYSVLLGLRDSRLATADVYRRLDELRGAGRWTRAQGWFINDLEAAAVSLDPGVGTGLEAMRSAGTVAAFVAGSGPTVVGLVPTDADAGEVAARAAPAFRRLVVTAPSPWGVRMVLRGRDRPGID